jgi:hypothetical protein
MAKTYVTVCKNTVLRNLKRGENKPPLRVSYGKYGKPRYRRSIEFDCRNVKVVYDPKNPLPWGARAWIEIDG